MKDSVSQKTGLVFLGVGVALVGLYFIFWGNRSDGLKSTNTGEKIVETEKIVVAGGKYQSFSEEAFIGASDKRRIYFFSAVWCSTCRASNQDFLERADLLPDDVVVFKIDYDSNKDLRKKFGIPYQHTFVEVDENGEKIQMWSGGSVDEVLEFMK